MQLAMSGGRPDRTPFMCQMSIGHMLQQLNVAAADFWCDPRVFADGLVRLQRQYGFDGILVSLHGHDPEWRQNIRERFPTDGGESIRWNDGSVTFFPLDDLPHHTPVSEPEPREIDPSLIPKEIDYIPVSQGLHFHVHPKHAFDILHRVRSLAGSDVAIHAEVTSPFDYFLDWLGHERGLMVLIDDPLTASLMLKKFAAGVAVIADGMCREDIDAIKISSPFAGAGFLSRSHYEEFILPHERTVVEAIQRTGIPAYLHTCGAIGDRLDLMKRTGARGLECLDPPPIGSTDLEEAFRILGGSMFVKGNVDPVNTLLLASDAQMREDVCRRIALGKKYGRFILSTACSIAPHVPKEKILMMKSIVEQDQPRKRTIFGKKAVHRHDT